MTRIKSKWNKIEYIVIGFSILIGGGSLIIFMAFLFFGSLNIVNLDIDFVDVLWTDFSLCMLFFLQHSIMVRESFRKWSKGFLSPHYNGVFYAISSGVFLLLLVILWQDSERTFLSLEGIFYLFSRLTFILSIVGLLWSAGALSSFDIIGKNEVLSHIRSRKSRKMPFTIRGPYRFVRHPFYFFMLVMIWSSPVISLDRLLFNALWSIWVIVGTVLEERDLVVSFGAVYREYQKKVPMLIPWRIW